MDKAVDTIVFAGDVADLPSCSSWDSRGSRRAEGRRLARDLDAVARVLEVLWEEWAPRGFEPETHLTEGNHEDRLYRMINEYPEFLDGIVDENDPFGYRECGWEVHQFLKPVDLDGIRYCHYFPHNAKGAVTQTKRGAPSARAQAQRQMMSATAGHQQGLDVEILPTPDGMIRGLIAGSYYLHNEDYMGPLNHYWRGLILKNNVRRGNYSLCEVDMAFLRRKYGPITPPGRHLA